MKKPCQMSTEVWNNWQYSSKFFMGDLIFLAFKALNRNQFDSLATSSLTWQIENSARLYVCSAVPIAASAPQTWDWGLQAQPPSPRPKHEGSSLRRSHTLGRAAASGPLPALNKQSERPQLLIPKREHSSVCTHPASFPSVLNEGVPLFPRSVSPWAWYQPLIFSGPILLHWLTLLCF